MELPHNAISKIFGGGSSETKDTNDATASTGSPEIGTKNDATIDAKTNAPVEHEQVNKFHEEKVQEVVEKEVHQDHYHTTVQPLKEREVQPEQHDYQEGATEQRSFIHDDADKTNAKLEEEQAQFRNTTTQAPTVESKTQEATVVGEEHVHHHYHETIQPVIEKETIVPSVTHTTIPVHETHQEASVVHGTSVAEPMSVDEFKSAGNTLSSSK